MTEPPPSTMEGHCSVGDGIVIRVADDDAVPLTDPNTPVQSSPKSEDGINVEPEFFMHSPTENWSASSGSGLPPANPLLNNNNNNNNNSESGRALPADDGMGISSGTQVHPSDGDDIDLKTGDVKGEDATGHGNHSSDEHRVAPPTWVLKYTRFLVKYWWLVMLCSMFVIFLCTYVAFVSDILDKNKDSTPGVFMAVDSTHVRRWYAQEALLEGATETREVAALSRTDENWEMDIYYTAKVGNNMLTPTALLALYDEEVAITGGAASRGSATIDNFDSYCFHQYSGDINNASVAVDQGCVPIFSLLNNVIFHNQTFNRTDVLQLTQKSINESLANYTTPEWLEAGYRFFFDNSFEPGNDTAGIPANYEVKHTRSKLNFGMPLNSTNAQGNRIYLNEDDNLDAQEDKHLDFMKQYTDMFELSDPAEFTVNYVEGILSVFEISELVNKDLLMAVGAGILVVLFIWLQTGSIFLAFTGILSIVSAYPISVCVYHAVLGYYVNTQFNTLALFIILGIGADDIFVLVDAWKSSALINPVCMQAEGRALRMAWCWHRAAKAMFVTSITTFVAFSMTGFSPIPSVGTFGVMSALLVLFNYLLVITLMPTVLVVYAKLFERLPFLGCCYWRPVDECCRSHVRRTYVQNKLKVVNVPQDTNTAATPPSNPPSPPLVADSTDVKTTEEAYERQEVPEIDNSADGASSVPQEFINRHRPVERMFYNVVGSCTTKLRYVLVVCFLVLTGLGLWGALQLEPPSEEERFYPDDSEFAITLDLNKNEFPRSSLSFTWKVSLIFGISRNEPTDRGGRDSNIDDDFGTLRTLPSSVFEVTPDMVNFVNLICNRLKTQKARDNSDFLATNEQIRCFAGDFIEHETNNGRSLSYSPSVMAQRLHDFVHYYDNTTDSFPYRDYLDDIGGISLFSSAPAPSRVSYLHVYINSTIPTERTLDNMDFWLGEWDYFTNSIIRANASANNVSSNAVFHASVVWAWKETTDVMTKSTFQAIFLSFAVSTVVLLISTGNYVVGGAAVFTIFGIVAAFLGAFVLFGRKLGTAESINSSILVGLAVDYVVHFANAVVESRVQGSILRSRFALLEMGVSVLSGMVTSVSSASVLAFFTKLSFFRTFGTLQVMILTFSFVYAVLWFIPMMAVFGPKKTGDYDIRLCCGKSKKNEDGEGSVSDGDIEMQEMKSV